MDQIFDEIVVNLSVNCTLNVSNHLKKLAEKLTTEESRVALNSDIKCWIVLAQISDNVCHQIKERNEELLKCENIFELITNLFRVLRNSLVNCPQSKQSIVAVGSLLDNVGLIFMFLIDCNKRSDKIFNQDNDIISKQLLVQSLKCCLQVLANLLSGSDASPRESLIITSHVWKLISFDLFR